MEGQKILSQLDNVPETLLIPLRVRYLETQKKDGIIHDPKSVEILDQVDYDFSKTTISKGSQFGVSVRTEILDEQTRKFLSKHPKAVVVNLGCGLDTRFHRLDNGSVVWFDLDLPEAISLRKHFFPETDRHGFIAKSVLDFSWIEEIPKDLPTLFIAEGLLMYFTESEVRSLFEALGENFPKAEMVLEAMSPFVAKRTEKHPDLKNYNATFKWGIKTGKEIETWGLGLKFISEDYYFDRHKNKIPFAIRTLSIFPGFRKMMKIVHLRF
ncbi:class I SAM-dependent methyltransferase [Dethiosulfatarculus sandiegensis]|uniref:O-methyltransferase involved in polyketide biosynthesis n=1 Tax=Dethiosulfatarculus sandiegensis TaxID=1429043 RepID=A0A0D2JUE4_9BACT|nr:class I SAM-dependent methyltransferase [Dethiosulfatarculus sandiegensis]KIX13115.1 O-methyltransferase involved in polyketide biosynthesis [Dethiosulfatarculus sandiegensis]